MQINITNSPHVPSCLSNVCIKKVLSHLETTFQRILSPPASFSSSSMLVLMALYSASMFRPPLIRLRTSRASWLRPFLRSQRGLSGRKMKPMNCSTAGTTDKPSMYLQYGENAEGPFQATSPVYKS